MQGACAGLRVLDLTQGMAGPLATMILADFGADVVRIEPPEGDPFWSDASYLLLQRGKQSVSLDSRTDAGRAELANLAAGMDVVVESIGAEATRRAGVGYDELSGANPGLVYCSISGFGPSGPFVQVKADDGLVMAKAGILRDQPGWFGDGQRPVYRAPRDGSYFAAMLAVQGILAAVMARDLTGRGQLIETNLLQALCCRQNPKVRWLLRDGESLPIETSAHETAKEDEHSLAHHRDPREINLIGMRVQTKDGRWMVHSHTEPHFFPAWINVLGFDWIWEDERFKGAPHQFPDEGAKFELVRLISDRMKERTSAEWMEAYLQNGNVCGDVIQSTQEALRHRQMVETDNVQELDDPRVGPLLQVGPLAKIPGAPASIRGAAPTPGRDSAPVVHSGDRPATAAAPEPSRALRGPLDGITIVECAYYYATPFATALLADMGARVIKIERLQGDPYRLLGGDPYGMSDGGSDPVLNLGHNNMVRAMQGKESIALNLKDQRGRKILHSLVAKADVFVHSFRPGVPESLGIDDETLRRINPDLVYQYGAVLRFGRPLQPPTRHRPHHRRLRRHHCPAGGSRQPASHRDGRRPGGRSRTCDGDGPGPVRAPSQRPWSARRVIHDCLEHLPQLRRCAFLRGQAAPPGGRPPPTRYRADPQALRDSGACRGGRAGVLREPRCALGVPFGRERRGVPCLL